VLQLRFPATSWNMAETEDTDNFTIICPKLSWLLYTYLHPADEVSGEWWLLVTAVVMMVMVWKYEWHSQGFMTAFIFVVFFSLWLELI
jgi:hypothetical protein